MSVHPFRKVPYAGAPALEERQIKRRAALVRAIRRSEHDLRLNLLRGKNGGLDIELFDGNTGELVNELPKIRITERRR